MGRGMSRKIEEGDESERCMYEIWSVNNIYFISDFAEVG